MSGAVLSAHRDPGSFRDPAGNIYHVDGKILRAIFESARQDYESIRDRGLIEKAIEGGYLIGSKEIPPEQCPKELPPCAYVIEHETIPYISYPYELSFPQLQAAALLHLDLQLMLLEENAVLTDASAYNIQFIGGKPIFIDLLSMRSYREREFWGAHRQFCEQFLNPLLLRSLKAIPHNAWYRGSPEGIETIQLADLLSLKDCFSWNIISQVILPARFIRQAIQNPDASLRKAKQSRAFSRAAYFGFLRQLRNWIAKMRPKGEKQSVWSKYADTNSYDNSETEAKKRFVAEFVAQNKPKLLFDMGCNVGDYTIAALQAGAGYVVGFDADLISIEAAHRRAVKDKLPFLALWQDATHPSPDQGWQQRERSGFAARAKADGVLALAFLHHLVIGRNVPLSEALRWLVAIAPRGVIEFVPKNDPTIQKMLALREDIFPDYDEASFLTELQGIADIRARKQVSASGRTLFAFERK